MNVFADEMFGTKQACATDRYWSIDQMRAGRKVAEYGIQQMKAFDGGPVFYVEVGTHDTTLLAALGKTVYSPWLGYEMLLFGDDAQRMGAITTDLFGGVKSTIAEAVAWPTVEEVTPGPSDEVRGDFTADEWATLGEEIGAAKRGLLAADAAQKAATSVVADLSDSEPMIRLGALSIRGNPMRPRRRAA